MLKEHCGFLVVSLIGVSKRELLGNWEGAWGDNHLWMTPRKREQMRRCILFSWASLARAWPALLRQSHCESSSFLHTFSCSEWVVSENLACGGKPYNNHTFKIWTRMLFSPTAGWKDSSLGQTHTTRSLPNAFSHSSSRARQTSPEHGILRSKIWKTSFKSSDRNITCMFNPCVYNRGFCIPNKHWQCHYATLIKHVHKNVWTIKWQ